MRAIILPAYNPNVFRALLSLKVETVPSPNPGKDEVLVDLYAATCNPSDIAFICGTYNIVKPLPAIPGFNLIDWKEELEEEEFSAISATLQEMFITGFLKTKIQSSTTLDDILSGLKSYIKNMSAGKLIIKP